MQRVILFLLLMVINLFSEEFNRIKCQNLTTTVEIEICQNFELAKLDKILKRKYLILEEKLSEAYSEFIETSHKKWLLSVDKRCSQKSNYRECLKKSLESRIKIVTFLNNYKPNPPRNPIIEQNLKPTILRVFKDYQNNLIDFSKSKTIIEDLNCLKDRDFIAVKRGIDKLFFYYYLFRTYFTDNKIIYFSKAYRDGLNLTLFDILTSINDYQYKELLKLIKLKENDTYNIYQALFTIDSYYYKYQKGISLEKLTRIAFELGLIKDEIEGEHNIFYTVGFPQNRNQCFNFPYETSNISIKGYKETKLKSSISLDEYMYSFWYRRDLEKNTDRVKEMLEAILIYLRNYIEHQYDK